MKNIFKKFNKVGKVGDKRGFTLIEILVVIGIIAILATIVIIAINPARQFAQARNTQRVSNVNTILNAIGQRIADNKGVFEGAFTINSTTYTCGKLPSTASSTITTNMAASISAETGDLGCLIPTFAPSLPSEPVVSATQYEMKSVGGRIIVCAPAAANETNLADAAPICVAR